MYTHFIGIYIESSINWLFQQRLNRYFGSNKESYLDDRKQNKQDFQSNLMEFYDASGIILLFDLNIFGAHFIPERKTDASVLFNGFHSFDSFDYHLRQC